MEDQPFFLGAFLGIFIKRLHALVKKQDFLIPFSPPTPVHFQFNENCHLAFGSGNPNIFVLRDSPANCQSCLPRSAHNKVEGVSACFRQSTARSKIPTLRIPSFLGT